MIDMNEPLLICGFCGSRPHQDFYNEEGEPRIAFAVVCICGRHTAWHQEKTRAVNEWNHIFGMIEPPITKLDV